MVLYVKSVLSFMVTALVQNILHENHGLIRGIYLKKIPVKKNWQQGKSKSHKKDILAKANLTIKEFIASKNNQDPPHVNELYIGKLVQIFYFLSRNNLAVKCLYLKFVEFFFSSEY